MTMPSLPVKGSTDWFAWAQGADTAANAVTSGRLADATLRAEFVPFWTAGETVTTGTVRVDSAGHLITANSNRTTGSTYDTTEQAAWTVVSGGGSIASLPAGSVLSVVQNGDGSWPNRPTTRTDVRVFWLRVVAGSADPALVTSPSVTGAYSNDVVLGA